MSASVVQPLTSDEAVADLRSVGLLRNLDLHADLFPQLVEKPRF